MALNMSVEWIDRHREPRCAPNPAYPSGKDVDASVAGKPSCRVDLPYPAKRCGYFAVKCGTCGLSIIITTAGRADDPRSLTVACKARAH